MSHTFYKWAMIIDLVVIGVLRFLEGTFFVYSITYKIIDAILYVIAIIFAITYLRKKYQATD